MVKLLEYLVRIVKEKDGLGYSVVLCANRKLYEKHKKKGLAFV